MDKPLSATLLLLLWLRGRAEPFTSCPYRCQCFSATQVLCADEHMTSLPSNLSRQAKHVMVMTTAVVYLFPHTLQDSPQLTKLVFLNNGLRSIHSQSLENLTELQELEISGNPTLKHLYLGTFSKQGNLSKLLLNFNQLLTLPPGLFDSLKQLEVLQMKSNVLSHLPVLIFSKLQRLRVLDLSLNQLEEMKADTFVGLAGLEILKMSHNLLSNLTFETFHTFRQLTELHLDGNRITRLQDGLFSKLTHLEQLNLRGNLLTTFSDKVFGFPESRLKELNLQGNKLTELSSISSLTSLTDLILSSNLLSRLSEDVFRNTTALESLDLSENQLVFLPKSLFRNLQSINMINLHQNNLSTLDERQFEDQQYIQQIDLSHNQFETLPHGLFKPFFMQHTMRLHGNPWRCDCRMSYLHHWVTNHSQGIEMRERMLCESPDLLKKRTVVSVDKDQLLCPSVLLSHRSTAPQGSACSLQASNLTVLISCQVSKCVPLTVKVRFEEVDGSLTEHTVKHQPQDLRCVNETTTEQQFP